MTQLTAEERRRAYELRRAAWEARERRVVAAAPTPAVAPPAWHRVARSGLLVALALTGMLAVGQFAQLMSLHAPGSVVEWMLPLAR